MDKKALQFGNFLVAREENTNGFDWIRIKAVSGAWSMGFRGDNEQFERIRELANNTEYRSYFEAWLTMVFIISNGIPDGQFMGDFYKSYDEMNDRFNALKKQLSDKEDLAILKEEKERMEIEEELNREENNENS